MVLVFAVKYVIRHFATSPPRYLATSLFYYLCLPTTPMTFSHQLLEWYQQNKRDLPWRRTKDPYLVWLSEIIMQQTRIVQGLPYYERFARAWPTVEQFAAAGEQEILKMWQGLGYYSRARNMHEAARTIMKVHGGEFPRTYDSLRSLKGVGDYTAAAIGSIVFGLPHPVIDGNVTRFMARLNGIGAPADLPATKRLILEIATGLIDPHQPGDFNQAMMEFGATVCTPANPGCTCCIFNSSCVAFERGMVDLIPARAPKPPVKLRYLHYLVVTFDDKSGSHIFLNKRSGNDIWKNLYDFPEMDQAGGEEEPGPIYSEAGGVEEPGTGYESQFRKVLQSDRVEYLGVSAPYTHLLTHRKLQVRFYRFHSAERIDLPFMAVPLAELGQYPFPRPVDRYLKENAILLA